MFHADCYRRSKGRRSLPYTSPIQHHGYRQTFAQTPCQMDDGVSIITIHGTEGNEGSKIEHLQAFLCLLFLSRFLRDEATRATETVTNTTKIGNFRNTGCGFPFRFCNTGDDGTPAGRTEHEGTKSSIVRYSRHGSARSRS